MLRRHGARWVAEGNLHLVTLLEHEEFGVCTMAAVAAATAAVRGAAGKLSAQRLGRLVGPEWYDGTLALEWEKTAGAAAWPWPGGGSFFVTRIRGCQGDRGFPP